MFVGVCVCVCVLSIQPISATNSEQSANECLKWPSIGFNNSFNSKASQFKGVLLFVS